MGQRPRGLRSPPGRGRRKGSWPRGEARNRSRGGPWRGRWQPGICPSPLQAGHAGPVGWCVLAQRPRVGPAADLVSAPLRAGGPKWPQARCCPPVQLLAVHPPGLPAKRGFPGLRPSGPQPCPRPSKNPCQESFMKPAGQKLPAHCVKEPALHPLARAWSGEPLPSSSHFWLSWGLLCSGAHRVPQEASATGVASLGAWWPWHLAEPPLLVGGPGETPSAPPPLPLPLTPAQCCPCAEERDLL